MKLTKAHEDILHMVAEQLPTADEKNVVRLEGDLEREKLIDEDGTITALGMDELYRLETKPKDVD